jgi:hypothetical protein
MPSELSNLRFGNARDECQMVVRSPLSIALAPPSTNLAVRSGLGVKLATSVVLYSPLETLSDLAIVSCIVQNAESLWFEGGSGRHHVGEVWRELLYVG